MKQHYIIMSSSYTRGTRIAMDIVDENELKSDYITKLIHKIKSECGADVSLSTHSILAESEDWSSVLKADKFFENVEVISKIETFIREIKRDRTLKGIDVAKYILSKMSCTHLKLEKLVYLCFAEYLCKTKQRLFDDKIFAFRYGPVIESVYDVYKKYGGEKIEEYSGATDIKQIEKEVEISDRNSRKIEKKAEFESPQRSRILFAEDGISKLSCIDSTIEKYKQFSANQLVKTTHLPESPWSKTYKGDMYEQISTEYILKYHCKESID